MEQIAITQRLKIALTDREKRLYAVLLELSEKEPGQWHPGFEIYQIMQSDGRGWYEPFLDEADFFAKAGKYISNEIQRINASGEYDRKVVSNRCRGYLIPTKGQFDDWAKRRGMELRGAIARFYSQCRSAGADGQTYLNFSEPGSIEIHDCYAQGRAKQ